MSSSTSVGLGLGSSLSPSHTVAYQCIICKVYFINYAAATVHLALRHIGELKTVFSNKASGKTSKTGYKNKTKTKSSNKSNSPSSSLIESEKFQQPFVKLTKLPAIKSRLKSNTNMKHDPESEKPTLISTVPLSDGRIEIKLDTLKASEIENLINDIYKDQERNVNKKSTVKRDGEGSKPELKSSTRQTRRIRKNNKTVKVHCTTKSLTIANNITNISLCFDYNKEDFNNKKRNVNGVNFETMANDINTVKRSRRACAKSSFCRHTELDEPIGTDFEGDNDADAFGINSANYDQNEEEDYTTSSVKRRKTEARKNSVAMDLKRHKKKITSQPIPESGSDLKCKYCGKQYKFPEPLRLHEMAHEKRINQDATDKPFQCPLCQHRFQCNYNLQRHMNLHLENSPYTCKFAGCHRKFNSDYNLRRHVKLHVSRELYKCDHCPAVYATFQKKREHMTEFHSNSPSKTIKKYRMPSTKRKYRVKTLPSTSLSELTQVGNLNDDQGTSHDEMRLETSSIHLEDKIVTNDQGDCDVHINGEILSPVRNHNKTEKPLSEIIKVEKSFRLRYHVDKDPVIQKLMEEQPDLVRSIYPPYQNNRSGGFGDFRCAKCDWCGPRMYFLQQHMKGVHNEELPTIPVTSHDQVNIFCGTCGYQASTAADLSKHINGEHFGNKKYPCNNCGKRFITEKSRNEHTKKFHFTERKFKCSTCGNSFHSKRSLVIHQQRVHSTREYKCDKCSKVLKTPCGLSTHKLLHSENRGLSKCNICGQFCANKSSLKRHIQYVHLHAKNPYNKKLKEKKRVAAVQQKDETIANDEHKLSKIECVQGESQPSESPELLGL